MQHLDFCLEGQGKKVFLNSDFEDLDLLLGYQVSGAPYPSVKDEVERVHLWQHEGMPHTQGSCPLVLRIVDEIREHYVTNFVDDRFDCSEQAMTARGKLHHTFP